MGKEWEGTGYGYGISFGDDGNVLKSDIADGCTVL